MPYDLSKYDLSKQEGFEQEYTLVSRIEGTSWSIWSKQLPWNLHQVVLKSDAGERLKRAVYKPLNLLADEQFGTLFSWRGRCVKTLPYNENDDGDYCPVASFSASEVVMDVIDVNAWVRLVVALVKVAEQHDEVEKEEEQPFELFGW